LFNMSLIVRTVYKTIKQFILFLCYTVYPSVMFHNHRKYNHFRPAIRASSVFDSTCTNNKRPCRKGLYGETSTISTIRKLQVKLTSRSGSKQPDPGLHALKGTNPLVAVKLWKDYALPRSLYGIETLSRSSMLTLLVVF
jgi:hypothetical protein